MLLKEKLKKIAFSPAETEVIHFIQSHEHFPLDIFKISVSEQFPDSQTVFTKHFC